MSLSLLRARLDVAIRVIDPCRDAEAPISNCQFHGAEAKLVAVFARRAVVSDICILATDEPNDRPIDAAHNKSHLFLFSSTLSGAECVFYL